MPITSIFLCRVRDLNRRGLTIALIAQRLGASIEDVREAHRMFALAENDIDEPVRHRTEAERQVALERMPLKMQERIRKSRGDL